MCALLRDNPSIRFQERFKNTGGSDTQFFMDLASVTTKYVWAEKAFVYESVLPERANAAWLFRRAIRIGNVNARYAPSVVQPLIGGATRIIAGAAYSAGLLLVRGRVNAKSFNMLGHGVGLIGHTLKRDVQEYK
jgi:succinoglycan biosynthesis protein ExoM